MDQFASGPFNGRPYSSDMSDCARARWQLRDALCQPRFSVAKNGQFIHTEQAEKLIPGIGWLRSRFFPFFSFCRSVILGFSLLILISILPYQYTLTLFHFINWLLWSFLNVGNLPLCQLRSEFFHKRRQIHYQKLPFNGSIRSWQLVISDHWRKRTYSYCQTGDSLEIWRQLFRSIGSVSWSESPQTCFSPSITHSVWSFGLEAYVAYLPIHFKSHHLVSKHLG